ncbi:MAG: winged helix-turn-helix transcriptional regulator [Lachnospiraceae bacterium]|nr:winged helix-turn-helix transcriptional regulator [Lachnospiraceae bacterium]
MIHLKSIEDGRSFFKALGSDIRIEIVKTLLENDHMNMNELASSLKITNGALTSHIKKLEECGIVSVSQEASGHGNQKICSVHLDSVLIDFKGNEVVDKNVYRSHINVGQYGEYDVYPTCGLASPVSLIGEVDDSRYFAHPDRGTAEILWFTRGYVEYIVPNFIPSDQKIDQLSFSMELGSEAPGCNDAWPSDIYFYINGTNIGMWTSPGDFGGVKGLFTPDWWHPNWNQYGLLKNLVINHNGTYIDGLRISDVSIDQFKLTYKSQIRFRLSVPDDAEHVGGLTIYGKNFGNYRQDIDVNISYSPINQESKTEE